MEIKEAQEKVDNWIKSYGVKYFGVLSNMNILMEEVGELARLAVRIHGEQSFKKEEDEKNADQNWSDEMADILFVLICLANQTGVDLEEAFHKNIGKKTERDKHRHINNEKLRKEDI